MDIASATASADGWFQLYGTTVSGTNVQKQVGSAGTFSVAHTPRIIAIGY
jgi:3D (Asp-Asp-Asp) domain-containing protein